MKKQIVPAILMSIVLISSSAFAKDWYEKSCTNSGKDKAGNYYVGGPYNKFHLHVGSNFLSVYRKNNESKPVTSGKANCNLIAQAITDVDGGGYTSPNDDVTVCLNAARNNYNCK